MHDELRTVKSAHAMIWSYLRSFASIHLHRARVYDPARLALLAGPERQRSGALVPGAHRQRPWLAQENDRGLGTLAADRALAVRARGCRALSSNLHSEGEIVKRTPEPSGPVRTSCDESPMTVRGGGVPSVPWLQCRFLDWVRRRGAFAADLQGCIMVRVIEPAEYRLRHDYFVCQCEAGRARSRQGRAPQVAAEKAASLDRSYARQPSELVAQADGNEIGGVIRTAAEQDRRRGRGGVAMRRSAIGRLSGDAKWGVLEEEVGIGQVNADLFGILVRAADAEKHPIAIGDQDVAGAVLNRGDLVANARAQQHCRAIGIFGTEREKPAVTIV